MLQCCMLPLGGLAMEVESQHRPGDAANLRHIRKVRVQVSAIASEDRSSADLLETNSGAPTLAALGTKIVLRELHETSRPTKGASMFYLHLPWSGHGPATSLSIQNTSRFFLFCTRTLID